VVLGLRNLRCSGVLFGLLDQVLCTLDIGTQIDHHAREHGSIQAGVLFAVDPFEGRAIRCGGFLHVLVADVDLGLAVDAFETGAETLALAAVEYLVDNGAQRTAYPPFGDFGPVFGPVGLHQPCARGARAYGTAVVTPELDDFGIDVLGAAGDYQPAQLTIALDLDASGLGQPAVSTAEITRAFLV